MKIIKLFCYISAYFQYIFFKIIYGSKFKVGKHVTWRKGFSIMKERSAFVEIGDDCFFNNYCSIDATMSIKIGRGCLFGENVKIYDHNHKFNDFSVNIKQQGYSNGSVDIGDHCWIGSNVIILKDSKIGKNCVIGAGCVISGNIPDGMIVKNKSSLTFEKIIPKS